MDWQPPKVPNTAQFLSIEKVLHANRLSRYETAANGNPKLRLDFYIWNSRLCEAFYLPLQVAEVTCRNALNLALVEAFGTQWYDKALFKTLIDKRFHTELEKAVREERGQHGVLMDVNHVVSALTFGFWEHIVTKRFDRTIWDKGIRRVFLNAPPKTHRSDLQQLIESVRKWRNRIAHHRAIFDKSPMRKHQDALKLIEWACVDTKEWVASLSSVPTVISQRPKITET